MEYKKTNKKDKHTFSITFKPSTTFKVGCCLFFTLSDPLFRPSVLLASPLLAISGRELFLWVIGCVARIYFSDVKLQS